MARSRTNKAFSCHRYRAYLAVIAVMFLLIDGYTGMAMLHSSAENALLAAYMACNNVKTVDASLTDDIFSKFLVISGRDVIKSAENRTPFTLDALSPTSRVLFMDRLEKTVLASYLHSDRALISHIEIGNGPYTWQIFFNSDGVVQREQITSRPLVPGAVFCGETYPVTQYGFWASQDLIVRSDYASLALARLPVSFLIVRHGTQCQTIRNDTSFSDSRLEQYAMRGNRRLPRFSRILGRVYEDPSKGIRVSFGFTPLALIRSQITHYRVLIAVSILLFAAAAYILYLHFRSEERYFASVISALDRVSAGVFCPLPTRRQYGCFRALIDAVNRTLRDLERHLLREREESVVRHRLESQVLLLQVNPHFLYNSLESVCALALGQGDEPTADAVASISELYRALVKEPSVIPMSRETELLDHYLRFQEMTRQDKFCYSIELDDALRPTPTLRFWLQPLAENYFRYSFDAERENNVLVVRGAVKDGICRFEMVDNGSRIPAAQVSRMNLLASGAEGGGDRRDGIGISNTAERLRSFYGGSAFVRFRANKSYGLTVLIQFPLKKEDDRNISSVDCG